MINGRDAKLLCLILLIVLGQKKKVNTLKDKFFGLVNNTTNAIFLTYRLLRLVNLYKKYMSRKLAKSIFIYIGKRTTFAPYDWN